nr:uncharacterized protein LOC127303445 [Lolium perenne]XP_051206531.1 uncharacterized protein LOC127321545 [Lolium perenne]XP_051220516.1 uncharacterized protein LOC127338454 [Lolium perenne]
MSLLEQFKVCQTSRNGLTGHFAQSVISDMKVELAKPKKDGIEKTQEECLNSFSKVLQCHGIANNTFLRNAGFTTNLSRSKSKSKPKRRLRSKSLSFYVLEELLKEERAIVAAQRVVIHRITAGLEASQAHLGNILRKCGRC